MSFTAATYGAADYALFYVDGGPVRMRFGSAPTQTSGIILHEGQTWELENARELADIQFISEDGSTHTVMANFGVKGG